MKVTTKRNNAIEALRFLFMVQICVWHFQYPVAVAGFVGVEFYFILAGFFIYLNGSRDNAPGVVDHTVHKVRKFYLKYVLASILGFIVFGHTLELSSFQDKIHALLNFISQLMMLQSIGIYPTGLNSPLWFFSVLIFGGGIVYALVRYYREISVRIIFPLLFILYMTECFHFGTRENLEAFYINGALSMPLARGIVEIGFGCLVGYAFKNYGYIATKHAMFLNVLSIMAIILYVVVMVSSRNDVNYVFIFFPIMIIAAMQQSNWLHRFLNRDIWSRLGGLSYDLYLIHAVLIALCKHFLLRDAGIGLMKVAIVYYLLLLPCAYAFDRLSKMLSSLISTKFSTE